MRKAPLLGKLNDQMRRGFQHFLKPRNLLIGKAADILPPVSRQKAGGMVEAVFRIRLFNIHLDLTVGLHLGANDLRVPVNLQKGIHHRAAPSFPACSVPYLK